METRLLVLGAGRHQKALIQRAEARGVRVVVADYLPDAPGKRFASHPTGVSAIDRAACEALAREYAVSGVITTGTDQPVVAMAHVAAALGLPCYVTPEAAHRATDKRAMKRAFARAGVPCAPWLEVADAGPGAVARARQALAGADAWVVKPADSQGQRGTRRVDGGASDGELAEALAGALAHSRAGGALVEAFLPGREITVSAWAWSGRAELLLVTDRVTYNPPPAIGICFQHVAPSRHGAGHGGALRAVIERVYAAYGVTDGPLYVQLIVRDADIRVVEAGCRVGGGHEASLIPLVTGVDVIDRLIDIALTGACAPVGDAPAGGGPVDASAGAGCALTCFLFARPGVVATCEGMDEAIASGLAVEGAFYVGPGHRSETITDGQARVGYFLCADRTPEALAARARRCYESLALRDDAGRDLLFWPPDAHLLR